MAAKAAPKQEMTAAEQYAALKEAQFDAFIDESFTDEALKGVELYEVKTPSGMVFKCRKTGLEFLTATGQMPMALRERLLIGREDSATLTDQQKLNRFGALPAQEKRASIEATAKMVRYVCVEPRIIRGEVNGHRNAISADALTLADFGKLAAWANGGDGAAGLKTFRRKR